MTDLQYLTFLESKTRTFIEMFPDEVPPILRRDLFILLDCVKRVVVGNLTEEEFQNLCHNLSPEDMERFKEGCRQMWDRMSCSTKKRKV